MFGYDEDALQKARRANSGPIEHGMFGYSAREMRQVTDRRSRILRALVLLIELVVLMAGLFCCFAYWLTTTPDGLRLALRRIVGDAPVAITFDDVYVHPGSTITDPATWKVMVQGLHVQQLDHPTDGVTVTARWAIVPVPNLFSAWFNQDLFFENALAIGLEVVKADDGIPREPNWLPKKTALNAITVQHLSLWDGSFVRDTGRADSGTNVAHIYGQLDNMRYEPGPRLLSGGGELFARHFRDGGIVVDHLVASATASEGDLVFDATGRSCGGSLEIHGTIAHLERRAAVRIDVRARGLDLNQMVRSATDNDSPVYGRVSGTVEVASGGEIPRGGAWMEAQLTLDGGIIPLEDRVGGFARDLLRLVPWIEMNDRDEIELGPTHVALRLERGTAIIHELRHQTPTGRWISMTGDISQDIQAVVRFEPRNNPDTRPGFGFVIEGAPGDLHFHIARRHELLPSVFADEHGERLSREERRIRRRELRHERRHRNDDDEDSR